MASNLSKRIAAAKENPIDVYGDQNMPAKVRLNEEAGIEALVGEHESGDSASQSSATDSSASKKGEIKKGEGVSEKKVGGKAQKKASHSALTLEQHRMKAQKRPAFKGEYATEYARRMSGKPTRFTK